MNEENKHTDEELEQAFFILRHGSSEGLSEYIKAVLAIESEYDRQKAEIERLTEERENMQAVIFALEEEKRLSNEQLLVARLQGLNEGYNNGVQAERNAQILKPIIAELPKEITEQIKEQAVKDTAKEILDELLDIEAKDYEVFFLCVCDKLEKLSEKFGVEIE